MTTHNTTLSSRSIFAVYTWLMVLTGLELFFVFMHIPNPAGAILLGASTLSKAMLILLYFMHLKFDGALTWLLPAIPIALAIFFVLMIFPDLVFHLTFRI